MNHTTTQPVRSSGWFVRADDRTNERIAKGIAWVITIVLAANQFMIAGMLPKASATGKPSVLKALFGVKSAAAMSVIGPKLNPDGKTTSLVEQPTISEVPGNPKSGDALADAKTVMLGRGSPAYAPNGISFDDPVAAQNAWAAYEESITLSAELQSRYDDITNMFTCNYCCGEPMSVTRNRQCGCAHAKAARGYFKYMLQTYGGTYSNEQLMGEAFRWQAIWYPKGAVEDYLLATGKSDVIGHATHGGAGTDGMHGAEKK